VVIGKALSIWMNGEHVGRWYVERGQHHLAYDPAWAASARGRALSVSLPLTATQALRGPAVANYFDNLLPDNPRIRERIAARYRTGSTAAFELLQAIGRDCVGAVQLLPDGAEPEGWDRIDSTPLTEAEIAALLRGVADNAPMGRPADALRLSLAGAQEKTALLRHQGRWQRPLGATPTTHILKLPLGLAGGNRRVDLTDSVENEWLCALLCHALGLPVAPAEIWHFEDQKALAVSRFDRALQQHPQTGQGWIVRLPQEDFCQAFGLPPTHKYEQDGGPGIEACLRLLSGSQDATDRATFALTQLTFWLLAATDGHAKNFSIFLRPGGRYVSTPLYDVLSIHPYVGDGPGQIRWRQAELAMALRGKNVHYALSGIQARHWQALAARAGGPAVWAQMLALVERVEPALAQVEPLLPASFPARIWDRIAAGLRAQRQRFLDSLTAAALSKARE
jgi:serine/threonine-protein kinase HipA